MPKFTADQLKEVSYRIFSAVGAGDAATRRVSEHLVMNNLVGHDSHGVIVIPYYLREIREGKIRPQAEMEVIRETDTTALIDGHWALGQFVAAKAMMMAIEKAKDNHVSAVGIFHCGHIGRVGEYPMMAAEHGLIGMTLCIAGPSVTPFGGVGRVLSTNPFAVGIPAGEMRPLLIDMATAACSLGKVALARNRGERLPQNWILDKNGDPTTDPEDFYSGGVQLAFGGHKGYALCLFVEILAGALTGHGCSALPEFEGGNGVFMMAINTESFGPLEEFKDTVDRLFRKVKEAPTAPGFEEVLIPGEPEFRAQEKREKEGITVSNDTWQQILNAAKEVGADLTDLDF